MLPWQRRRIEAFADLLDGRLAPEAAPRSLLAMSGVAGALSAIHGPATPLHLSSTMFAAQAASSVPASGAAVSGVHGAVVAAKLSAPAWLPLATGIASVTAAVTGVAVATAQAQPGDLFYGLKHQVERVQVATAWSSADAGRERLAQAQTRLHELSDLVARLPTHPTAAQLATVHGVVASWAGLVSAAIPALTHTVHDAEQLGAFLTDQAVTVARLVPELPAADADRLTSTLRSASAAVSAVKGLLPSAAVPSVTVPSGPVPVVPVVPGHSSPAPGSSPSVAPSPGAGSATPGPSSRLPSAPLPTPSSPSVPLPSVPLPSVPLPSLPVPSLSVPSTVPLPVVPSLPGGLLGGVRP